MRTRSCTIALALLLGAAAAVAEEVGVLVEHIEVSEAEATRLLLEDEDPVVLRAALDALLGAGEAKVTDLAYLLGRVGAGKSKAESALEYLYPTEWDPGEVVREIEVDVTAGMDLKTPANPTAFDQRQLGNTLEILARRRPDGRLQLDLTDELARLAGLRAFGAAELGISQPTFEVQSIAANPTCSHRRPVLLAVYKPRRAELRDRRVFAFATPMIRNDAPASALADAGEDFDPFGDHGAGAPEVLGVTVGAEYFEVSQAQLAGLLEGVPHLLGEVSSVRERVEQLVAGGVAKRLSSGTLKTTLGQRAKIEPVHEFIYPTEYDPPEIVAKLTPEFLASGEPLKISANPTAFDMRYLGMILEAEASLVGHGDDERIDLSFAVEVVDLARRIEWGHEEATTLHPIFGTQACTTQLRLKPGEAALAAILTPRDKADGAPDPQRRILIIVWADLARAKG